MTAPDLPMLERIAEALFDCLYNEAPNERRATWAGQPEGGEIRRRFLARADAVLAVLADLPDTAVEAGAKALWECESDAVRQGLIWACRMPAIKDEYRRRTSAALSAVIAAIKEGKA
ncbi:hypothetical protein [Galactobacter valiniphilus]|uniref:hypothetical protein n=1 Tax=Galactobacter valiniphilus TaxID=2676122 RepID=UPI003736CD23